MSDNRRWNAAPFPPALGADVRAVAFSPDGTTLATGGEDGVIRLWHVATGQLLDAYDARTGAEGVSRLAWVEEGLFVAGLGPARLHRGARPWSAPVKGLVEFLDARGAERNVRSAPDGELDGEARRREGSPSSGDTDGGGAWLVALDPEVPGRLRWWDVAKGRFTRATQGAPERHEAGAWRLGPTGDVAMIFGDEGFTTIDLQDGGRVTTEPAPPTSEYPSSFDPLAVGSDGTLACARGGEVWLRRPAEAWRRAALPAAAWRPIYALELSPDGSLLAVAGADRHVHLVDVATGSVARTLARAAAGLDIQLEPNGGRFNVLYDRFGVVTWDLRARTRLAVHRMPRAVAAGRLRRLALATTGLVAVTDAGDVLTTWDVATDTPLVRMESGCDARSRFGAPSVAWPWIARGAQEWSLPRPNSRLDVWDARSGEQVLSSRGLDDRQVLPLAHASGLIVRYDRKQGGLVLHDLAKATSTLVPVRRSRAVVTLAVSADATRMILGDAGFFLGLLDLPARRTQTFRLARDGAGPCAFSPDGARLAVGRHYDRGVSLWHECPSPRSHPDAGPFHLAIGAPVPERLTG